MKDKLLIHHSMLMIGIIITIILHMCFPINILSASFLLLLSAMLMYLCYTSISRRASILDVEDEPFVYRFLGYIENGNITFSDLMKKLKKCIVPIAIGFLTISFCIVSSIFIPDSAKMLYDMSFDILLLSCCMLSMLSIQSILESGLDIRLIVGKLLESIIGKKLQKTEGSSFNVSDVRCVGYNSNLSLD
ncbi:hypothetical protein EDL79_02190 [Ehrlichia ruminantium]|uniref:Uncharacterized protein n=1 Tax=Ehrlichia ruminantium TaxID=779 RepID=A0AAE6Q938_EHRRU|nr:hypothetical protein [Ehrlichia ruminantium]QGR03391.1 hypothetical protein EDL80_02190 [Ehrlichia ruminantium]QGR04318.1 hypothetical protein EDL79_02190 [Ehrlichia ruminantium]